MQILFTVLQMQLLYNAKQLQIIAEHDSYG